jgi:hypothetical protein
LGLLGLNDAGGYLNASFLFFISRSAIDNPSFKRRSHTDRGVPVGCTSLGGQERRASLLGLGGNYIFLWGLGCDLFSLWALGCNFWLESLNILVFSIYAMDAISFSFEALDAIFFLFFEA